MLLKNSLFLFKRLYLPLKQIYILILLNHLKDQLPILRDSKVTIGLEHLNNAFGGFPSLHISDPEGNQEQFVKNRLESYRIFNLLFDEFLLLWLCHFFLLFGRKTNVIELKFAPFQDHQYNMPADL